MRSNTWMSWVWGAAVMAAIGLMQNSADLLIASALVGSVGVALRASALRRERLQTLPNARDDRVSRLEEHLRLTEDELAATARELAALKEQHDFDRQLRRPAE